MRCNIYSLEEPVSPRENAPRQIGVKPPHAPPFISLNLHLAKLYRKLFTSSPFFGKYKLPNYLYCNSKIMGCRSLSVYVLYALLCTSAFGRFFTVKSHTLFTFMYRFDISVVQTAHFNSVVLLHIVFYE